ncbi:MAG: dual specificity protein phosphatase family protein [Deltaproteobacteria bacterium]
MAAYELSWITENLALGHAPMSYEELDSMRKQGISGIVNLCGEFCDLHEIQEESGFEVYYLPTCDNEAPSIEELEKALDWLDEAIYLDKKVLVHCRHGIGRTGTFVTAYLLRKGYGLKLAQKKVEKARATSSSFPQWRLLRKYHKIFFDYEALLEQVDTAFQKAAADDGGLLSCGRESEGCCYRLVEVQLIEAAYLSHQMNTGLTSSKRKAAIERAVGLAKRIKDIEKTLGATADRSTNELDLLYGREKMRCPLNVNSRCVVYSARPIACRLYGLSVSRGGEVEIFGGQDAAKTISEPQLDFDQIHEVLARISSNMLYALTSTFPTAKELTFKLVDTVSGRFVQQYFEYLAGLR